MSENVNSALEFIGGFSKSGSPVRDLMRFQALMDRLGNPQDDLKFIHIVGTNGKGSVTEYCARALQASGFRVGKYTSPYVECFTERIQLNGENISIAELEKHCKSVSKAVFECDDRSFSQFEIITAIAFLFYKEQDTDIVCLEAGIGGALDCTNVIKTPLAAVFTSIGLDHTEILGDTVEEIAESKAGIIKNNGKVVAANYGDSIMSVIKRRCEAVGAELTVADSNKADVLETSVLGSIFSYGEMENIEISMCGEHQIQNAVTAIEALKATGVEVSENALRAGLKAAVLPARMEIINRNPLVILDGAHNPQGIAAAARALAAQGKPVTAVIGMLMGKDYQKSLALLLPVAERVIFTDGFSENSVSAIDAARAASGFCNNISVVHDAEKAVRNGLSSMGDGILFVGGSFYLAAKVRMFLKEQFSS